MYDQLMLGLPIEIASKGKQYWRKFELETGCPLKMFKNNAELFAAYIFHKEGLDFKYGETYRIPGRGGSTREVDFTLIDSVLPKRLPLLLRCVKWPSRERVRDIEVKYFIGGQYDPDSPDSYKYDRDTGEILKDRCDTFKQREDLKKAGIVTYPVDMGALKHFFENGFAQRYKDGRLK